MCSCKSLKADSSERDTLCPHYMGAELLGVMLDPALEAM